MISRLFQIVGYVYDQSFQFKLQPIVRFSRSLPIWELYARMTSKTARALSKNLTSRFCYHLSCNLMLRIAFEMLQLTW